MYTTLNPISTEGGIQKLFKIQRLFKLNISDLSLVTVNFTVTVTTPHLEVNQPILLGYLDKELM